LQLKPTILIADSHALTTLGIRFLLQKSSNHLVVEAIDKTSLDAQLQAGSIVLLIIDYATLKDFSVEDLIELRKQHMDLSTLVFTSDKNEESILKVLEQGVQGFLFKDCSVDEISRAIESLLQGEKFFCNRVFDLVMQKRLDKTQPDYLLSSREIEIIKLVVKGQSTLSIADKLHLSPHTISTHRKNIIKKLKIKSPVELVAYAYELGLVK
jgi:DNA-binding NarL/FixJ family response regulator